MSTVFDSSPLPDTLFDTADANVQESSAETADAIDAGADETKD